MCGVAPLYYVEYKLILFLLASACWLLLFILELCYLGCYIFVLISAQLNLSSQNFNIMEATTIRGCEIFIYFLTCFGLKM